MGQNNDPTERGELQGNQGGMLSKDPAEHQRLRQQEAGYARPLDENSRRRREEFKRESR